MIYLLDDDPGFLQAVAQAVAPIGPAHATTLWSELAPKLIREAKGQAEFDVLVCDLEMPGINGLAFCDIVRRYNASLPIVLFSGAVERVPDGGPLTAKVDKRSGAAGLRGVLTELRDAWLAGRDGSGGHDRPAAPSRRTG